MKHNKTIPTPRFLLHYALVFAALILFAAPAPTSAQQIIRMGGYSPARFTIPINASDSVSNSVTVDIEGTGDQVDLYLEGLPPEIVPTLSTNNLTTNAVVTVTLNYTNVPMGNYNVALVATGVVSGVTFRRPMPVHAVYMWNNAAGTTNFSAGGNWVGGIAPSSASDAIGFNNAATTTNLATPTILVTTDTEVGSVRLTHGGDAYHNFSIASGATLKVTGNEGFYHLRDTIPAGSRSFLAAQGAGTLLVSNVTATFASLIDFPSQKNTRNLLNFSNLNTLKLDVSKIAFNDAWAYPDFGTNGNTTDPKQWSHELHLAKTNIFRGTFTDTNNWSSQQRDYGFVLSRSDAGGGTSSDFTCQLGAHNEFYFDSMLFGGAGLQNDDAGTAIMFNTNFPGTKSLFLRNTNGGRMSNLTIGDSATPNGQQDGRAKIIVELRNGILDALVDKLYLGRNCTNGNGGSGHGTLTFEGGTLNVNNAYLGYQKDEGGFFGASENQVQGTLNISSNAILVVNATLELGHTEEPAPGSWGAITPNGNTYGQLNMSTGAKAYLNSVIAGGPAGLSLAEAVQRISMASGSQVVISNKICAADARLSTLSMNLSTLSLRVNLDTLDPYVYVTTLTTGGTSNVLELLAITSSGSPTYPLEVPIISYTGVATPNFVLKLPSGFYGYVVNDTVNLVVKAIITTTPPKSVVWNGDVSGNWDLSTANWIGGQVFFNGDTVRFDDTATGTTSITMPGDVIPGAGGVLITNDLKSYSFEAGTISGTATMTKRGTNSLTMNASSALALTMAQGSLTVGASGTVGNTTASSVTTVNNAGIINRLTTSGTAVNTGTINIGLSVNGGTMDNAGTVNGSFSMSANTSVTNRSGALIHSSGTSTVAAGATLVNNGLMNRGTANSNSRLSIAGTLTGSGEVADTTGDLAGNNGRLEINAGGTFTPGGSNVIGSFKVSGRFDLNTGSPNGLMIIDVDLAHPQTNDFIAVDKWSNLRGALRMNNIGATPFAAGQSFHICRNNYNLANTPETAFDLANKITPAVPGVGLQWDLTNLRTNGIIAVKAAPLTPPALTSVFQGGTNLSFSWSTNYLGYQLQVQTNTLATGLSDTWYPVAGTEFVTATNFPIHTANPAVFYRLSNQ